MFIKMTTSFFIYKPTLNLHRDNVFETKDDMSIIGRIISQLEIGIHKGCVIIDDYD